MSAPIWKKTALLIPVENQVRELDAKLLLACVAARRGMQSVIGFKRDIEFGIASFPPSIFLAKSLRIGKRKIFPLSRRLGHKIVAWDEEALVHLPADIYYSRRLSARGMKYVSHLFAWGDDNAELWRRYPALPGATRIHVTGNPRGDLLRRDMRIFYQEEAARIRQSYGQFILVNTNFNHVNAFYPAQNLFQPIKRSGEEPEFGQAARGMPRKYAEGLRDHKQTIFEHFQRLIPVLDESFPEYTIVVRPHPTENQKIYQEIAARCRRVRVTNQGNVVPWLLATCALIHNGCTTGVEAYAMRVPSISYMPETNEYYDYGFYQLPNRLSYQCFNLSDLQDTLARILEGQLAALHGEEGEALVKRHLAAQSGPLACERIVDILQKVAQDLIRCPSPSWRHRLAGRLQTTSRRLRQNVKAKLPGATKTKEFQQHRYPPVALQDISSRIDKFQEILGGDEQVEVSQVSRNIFRVAPAARHI
ncbi:MAG: hypothetical protein JRJ12_06215 [Deltaproteobacteria bacterium]|nr:hypothetical protein [Deltaproteobacteria bacterium]MBW2069628.1 hypothetical protein [Deltaproteobacteria bacterium]